jgi:DNA-binding protein H-NS
MASINLSKLSASQLMALAEQAAEMATKLERRDGELKTLVNKLVEDAGALGFTVADIKAMLKDGPSKKAAKTTTSKVKDYVEGVTYKDPASDKTWTGGTKGPRPTWLRTLLESGKTFAHLAAK